jgi:tetratricopeptide (TPR) repeat protein
LIAGLGDVHHPVSTANAEAQRFFDQGLALVYAFNHDEAVRSFNRSAELDPPLAMAYWGIALALGPNINMDRDPEREKGAFEAIQKALSLARGASERERAYIEALAKRHSSDPKADPAKLNIDYKNAMAELRRRYPDDLNAAVLYADSLMMLRPWKLWSADGKPAKGTIEIVDVLTSVLKRDPRHVGANHYYIHAVEASPNPEWALASAERLKSLAPGAGHLVHMPAHIYMRTGDYANAASSNAYAVEVDREYFAKHGRHGMYPLMYYSHNLHFLAVAYAMRGRFEDAKKAADELEAHVGPFIKDVPMIEGFMPTPAFILVRFRRWDDIMRIPAPDNKTMPGTYAVWRFARGMALAATGKVKEAEAEQQAFAAAHKAVLSEAVFLLNSASSVLKVADSVLAAKIAAAKGDYRTAIDHLRKGVAAEDALNYDEPPGWYIPARESLGGALLMSGDYAEAERVFREDLERNPRNGRSLFGLLESLNKQGKSTAAQFVQREFEAAWKNADTKLRIEDL